MNRYGPKATATLFGRNVEGLTGRQVYSIERSWAQLELGLTATSDTPVGRALHPVLLHALLDLAKAGLQLFSSGMAGQPEPALREIAE